MENGSETMKTEFNLVLGFGVLLVVTILGYMMQTMNIYFYILISVLSSYLITEAINQATVDILKLVTWFGSTAIILSGLLLIFNKSFNNIAGIMLALGIFAFMISFYNYVGMEEPKDERLKKIGNTATTYSWYLTLLLLGSTIVSCIWSGETSISVANLGLILTVMVAVMMGSNIYFNVKGDVE